jgi:archaellum component FlaG (FlaF/FlaG flagellin family)
VTDETAPQCAKRFETLAPKEKQTYECTMTAPADDVVNTAKVTGKPPVGPPLDANDDATVDVIHPAVKITKDASPKTVREGDEVTFTIVVTNTGDAPLSTVAVTDDKTPGCAKTFDTLAPEGVQTYNCTTKAPPDDVTNTAGVTGTDPTGRPVTSTGTATVDVIHPQIALMKDATPYEVREGDTVTFTILVKNTGDVPLTGVTVADDHTPACAHTVAALAPDGEETYTCTTVAGKDGFTSTATVTGQDPTNRPVTATGDATFVVQRPGTR